MHKSLKILLLEDDATDAELIQKLLLKEKVNHEFRVARNKDEFLQALDEFSPEVILSDNSLPQFDSRDALEIVQHRSLLIPFILVTGTVSDEFAASIIKQGADDYILKDRMTRLPAAIAAGLNKRRAMKELKDYKYALDQSAIVSITDPKGIILFANDNFCHISKYAAAELIGKDHRIINSGHHSKSYIKEMWVTIGNGKIWRGEFRNKAKDGSFYWVDATIIPFLDERNKPYQYVAIRIDITEKKKSEEELRRSNERFQCATQATSDIIWELNFETKQYLVHQGKEKLFSARSILDWRMGVEGKYVMKEDRENLRQSFGEARMYTKRIFWELEYRVLKEDNSVMHIINHAMFIRDEGGKAIRAIGAITNITEKKKLETALLDQQRRELLNMTATTIAAQEKERNAIGAELHDNVNQILVGTNMMLSIIRDDPGKLKEYIDTCISSIREAVEENRKIAHELVSPDLVSISVLELIKQINENMLEPAGLKTFIHHENFREDWLNDDQKLAVYRIVQEQYTNIIKYAKANTVQVELSTTGDFFHMVIADDGIGMEPNAKSKGIGLTNIKSRLSVFNGTAVIATAPGNGFRLEVTIPFGAEE